MPHSGHQPGGFAAEHSARWTIVLNLQKVVLGQGGKSHEAAGIHQAFQQHRSCMAADRASTASGDAGDRLS
jgi:hypothetical protein